MMAGFEEAIPAVQDTVNMSPESCPSHASLLHEIGVRYGNRYQRTGDTTDLEKAIELFQESLDKTPSGHPEKTSRLLILELDTVIDIKE